MSLADAMADFDAAVKGSLSLATTPARVCTSDGAKHLANVNLSRADGTPSEQYYKWQLVRGLIQSGRFEADTIGCELSIPRGSKGSSSLYIDVALFKDTSWVDLYDRLTRGEPSASWDDLLGLLVGCGEIKDDPRDNAERTVSRQLFPALNSIPDQYALGFYYNRGHLVLFARSYETGRAINSRLDPTKQGTSGTGAVLLSLAVPDSYELFPTLHLVLRRNAAGQLGTRANRSLDDLDVTSSRSQGPVKAALDNITRILDQVSMGAETGYKIVVEVLATKVSDEKRSLHNHDGLRFFIDPEEIPTGGERKLSARAREFRDRLRDLHKGAVESYPTILGNSVISWGTSTHVSIVAEVVRGFQDISFEYSSMSDLYQVVFYNFAAPLSKLQQAQFMTPLRVIDFIVDIVNPKKSNTIIDPTMGIADFLAETFRRVDGMYEQNLYGIDNDSNMLMLAGLNMLLNGDGRAQLYHQGGSGSLDHKLHMDTSDSKVRPLRVEPAASNPTRWEQEEGSGFVLSKFDIVMTNPPFGEGRSLRLDDPHEGAENRRISSLYDISSTVTTRHVDKGLLFLENAVKSLKDGGRFAIILSAAIANVGEYEAARRWLLDRVRVVAIFDFPKDMFAETGIPTCVIVGYRPSRRRLLELQELPYQIYSKQIKRVGFTKQTRNRTTVLVDKFLLNPETGFAEHDGNSGEPLLDEEFTSTVVDFRKWAITQEAEVSGAFL